MPSVFNPLRVSTLLYLLYSALFTGCDKIPTGIIDYRNNGYHITMFTAPPEVIYKNDSSLVTSLRIDNSKDICDIWMEITYQDGTNIYDHISLADNGSQLNADSLKGDNVFSARTFLSRSNPNGRYKVSYYASTTSNETDLLAVHWFTFNNGKMNYPPVISELNMPDTVSVGQSFTFNLKAFSPDGLKDIKLVLFKYYRTDGSVTDLFRMYDDGDLEKYGDEKAGDGIYSFKSSFTEAAKGQSRCFVFQAVSQNDSLSNIITHNIYTK